MFLMTSGTKQNQKDQVKFKLSENVSEQDEDEEEDAFSCESSSDYENVAFQSRQPSRLKQKMPSKMFYKMIRKNKNRPENQEAELFFKFKQPKVNLQPDNPSEKPSIITRQQNQIQHKIQQIKSIIIDQICLQDKTSQEQIFSKLQQIDDQYLQEIDLSISQNLQDLSLDSIIIDHSSYEMSTCQISNFFNKTLDQFQNMLNPTVGEINQGIKMIEEKFRKYSALEVVDRLYEEILIKKRPLNDFLNPFWNKQRDARLIKLYITYQRFSKITQYFSNYLKQKIQQKIVRNRIQILLRKSMAKYNKELLIFNPIISNLVSLDQRQIRLILNNPTIFSLECRRQLFQLYLSTTIQCNFILQLAKKINALLKFQTPSIKLYR